MASAAQTRRGPRRSMRGSPPRTAALLRHLGAARRRHRLPRSDRRRCPSRPSITEGFGEGLRLAPRSARDPVRVGRDPPHADHVDPSRRSINAVMGTALAYILVRFRFPGRRRALVGRGPAARDPDARHGADDRRRCTARTAPSARSLDRSGHPGRLHAARRPARALRRDASARRAQRPAGAAGARPRRGGGRRRRSGRTRGRRSAGSCCPAIRPAVVGGTLLTFARCIGEFGSVVLVSGQPTRARRSPRRSSSSSSRTSSGRRRPPRSRR